MNHNLLQRRVCYERPTPTGDFQPSLRSPWLAADDERESLPVDAFEPVANVPD